MQFPKKPGLIIPEIKTREQGAEHILGSIFRFKGLIINPDGDWTPYLPDPELQAKRQVDSMSCATFGTLNAIETLEYKITGVRQNYSDRALAILSETTPEGNDPHKVAETIRKYGLVDESVLPWDEGITTWEQYMTITPEKREEVIQKGKEWLKKWDFGHEWMWNSWTPASQKRERYFEGLKKGTCGVSVYGWYLENEIYKKPEGARDNHWTQLANWHPNIFDSYEPNLKNLDSSFDFLIGKVFYLSPAENKTILEKIKNWLINLSAWLMTPRTTPPPKIDLELPELETPPVKNEVEILGHAIGKYENVNISLNNPGGLRSSPFQDGYIIQSSTGKKLATFDTMEDGWSALFHQIRIVCKGTSPAYTSAAKLLGLFSCADLTLEQFLHIYAPRFENASEQYVMFVERETGFPRSRQMKTIQG